MSSSTLAAALVEAQKEMPAVERDATNPHFRSSYTSLDRLIAKTKPVLTKHGLAIVQHHETSEGGLISLRTVLHHVSGEALNCGSVPLVGASDMQKLGSATTYARRYAWACLLGIADEEDDDGNAASAPAKRAQSSSAGTSGTATPTGAGSNGAPAETPAARTGGTEGRQSSPAADPPTSQFAAPAGQNPTDAQVKLLGVLFKKLPASGKTTATDMLHEVATTAGADPSAVTWDAAVALLRKPQASALISKFKELEGQSA